MVNSIFLFPVTEQEIDDIIHNLKAKKSCGWDEISMWIIKKCKSSLISPLNKLINKCFEVGIFPDCLKIAIVKPLLKKGNKCEVSNYRPISLIPNSCRPLFKENKILTIYSLYIFKIILLIKLNPEKCGLLEDDKKRTRNFNLFRLRVNKKKTERNHFISGVIY
jgi:hypothetical protein